MAKQVQILQKKNNLYLSVYSCIKKGLSPTQISKKLNKSKSNINYYISSLKANYFIEKIGYGVWKITDKPFPNKYKFMTRVTPPSFIKGQQIKKDKIRGHGFRFKFKINPTTKWLQREKYLRKANLNFKQLNLFGGGQTLNIKGRTIWLTNKSVIVHETHSYISNFAKDTRSLAIYKILQLIKFIERKLKIPLTYKTKYQFKIISQHYALVKNALARQYNKEGKKLQVYHTNGLWLIIDDSYNLNELELIHNKTAVNDTNNVQDFFNGLKDMPNFKPQYVMNLIGGIAANQKEISTNQLVFDTNMKSHIKAIKSLSKGMDKFNKLLQKMEKKIN